jgi:uncharacterized protein
MTDLMALSAQVLLAPAILFFLLGLGAAFLKSDLSIPEPIAKAMAIYLMVAIGFKGGHEVAVGGVSADMLIAAGLGMALSFAFPFLAFALIRALAKLDGVNAGAIAAHYGSISVVTFVTALEVFRIAGTPVPGYMVAVMALMETPAILSGLWLARRALPASAKADKGGDHEVLREVLFNGSVMLLVGAFVIAMISGQKGYDVMAPLIDLPFKAVLCFFLLDMGLVAARQLMGAKLLTWRLIACALILPPLGALLGGGLAALAGLPVGAVAALAALAASASYIAVPAAIRLTLPQANPGLYLTCSLAISFPFNVTIGLPLYLTYARMLTGAS